MIPGVGSDTYQIDKTPQVEPCENDKTSANDTNQTAEPSENGSFIGDMVNSFPGTVFSG